MRKITLKMRIKYANRKERQMTNNCHRYSLPCESNASSIIKIIGMTRGRKMNTTEKIKLLQELLKHRYPVEVYDKAEKNSVFRLRADKIINKIYQLEEELNHE